jgi:hypothetical protein
MVGSGQNDPTKTRLRGLSHRSQGSTLSKKEKFLLTDKDERSGKSR